MQPTSLFHVCAFLGIFFFSKNISGQSLIAGIPNADVAHKGKLELTHETQLNFWSEDQTRWNSFNFLCYGVGKNTELTVNLLNLSNQPGSNTSTALGFKSYVPILTNLFSKSDVRLTFGTNLQYSFPRRDWGYWAYSHLSTRLPRSQTRLTGGLSYGTSQLFGFRTVLNSTDGQLIQEGRRPLAFMGGIEQPLTKHVGLLADWFSGTHEVAALITGFQFNIRHQVLIVAYKHANNPESTNNALVLEAMIKF
jgi:hypothetical protein